MPEGGKIAVSTQLDGDFAVLTVSDTGIGMSEETKSRIFDPFYTTRGSEGTGLGMSIADAIISKHGGDIRVESEQGKGSDIIIRLPLADSAAVEPVEIDSPAPVQRSATILVVDDERMFGEVIGQMLVEGGHRATVVTTTSEALAVIEKGRYDILVTDLAMPEMSGCELARAAKGIDPDLAIILMTGFDSVEDRREIEKSGIDLVLNKPVQHDRLLEAMSEALGMRAAGRNAN
jgi:CheY-like chemotaxis protein